LRRPRPANTSQSSKKSALSAPAWLTVVNFTPADGQANPYVAIFMFNINILYYIHKDIIALVNKLPDIDREKIKGSC
jgi:hypothetical protein